MFSLGVPVVIVLNKVDNLKGGHIATQMDTASKLGDFHALHPVSAKTGDGIDALREELVELLPEGPAYFPADQRSDLSPEEEVAELIREKALALTREEVPHAISVEVEEIDEKVVRANVYVETESQKQIVVGKGGSVVKEIGTRARPEIEHLLGPPGLPRAACQGAAEMAHATSACSSASGSDDRARLRDAFDIDAQRGRDRDRLARRRAVGGRAQASRGARSAAPRRRARCRLHLRSQARDRDGGHRLRGVRPSSAPRIAGFASATTAS